MYKESRDLRTEAIVLKRTNYGEADRILTIITPEGKKSVLAKSVRREKSRLAGGIEMFSLSEVVIHQGRGDLSILTAAKPKRFYREILADFSRLEVASEILRRVAKAAEGVERGEFFELAKQSLEAINRGGNVEIILAWFYLNLIKNSGEQINVTFDVNGNALVEGENYTWDVTEKALKPAEKGAISTNEIKMMRLMLSAKLDLILRVKDVEKMAAELLYIAKSLNQL